MEQASFDTKPKSKKQITPKLQNNKLNYNEAYQKAAIDYILINQGNKNIKIKKSDDYIEYYLNEENKVIIQNYGPDIYEYSQELDFSRIKPDVLEKHSLDGSLRTKFIDWLIEVTHTLESDKPTLFLAVDILDTFLFETNKQINNKELHLYGVVCLYIASKFEDLYPTRLTFVADRICHKKYSIDLLKETEIEIVNTIGFDLIGCSLFDLISTFVYDLTLNQNSDIDDLNLKEKIKMLESSSMYMAKLSLHDHFFTGVRYIFK